MRPVISFKESECLLQAIKYSVLPIALVFSLITKTVVAADLLSVYQAAQTYDTTFAAAAAALRVGQEKNQQATALWLPKINLTSNYGLNDTEASPSQKFRNQDEHATTWGYGVSLSQPIYDTQVSVGSHQLNDQAKLAVVQFENAAQELILRVVKVYLDVLLSQDKLEMVRAQKEAVSQQLDQAKQSFDAGASTIVDIQEAQARYDGIIASEIAAQNDLAVSRNAFTELTGMPAEGLGELNQHMVARGPQPADVNEWLARGAANGLKIQEKRIALSIKAAEPNKYGAWRESTVSLQAGYDDGRKSSTSALTPDQTQSTYIGLKLNVPLYTGGNNSSKLREALAEKEQAEDELETSRRETALEIKRAFLGVTTGASQISALKQALVSAQSSLASTKLGREAGTRTTLDVLNAEQQLYSTRKDLAEARYTYLQNRLKLTASVGELSLHDLQVANAALHS
ncbi:TolC family outer membrane protein [Pseudomonas chlororaphis]|uniref:TolC family outer membrane protein n=1 Tax=Pseudomonas chlororaphis TaxID=587753 RepID=UPI0015DF0169|nr:TolC family outer membrane protein [Pseudomonas chlororaphis]QLL16415.1 TolC family outer membrane protein [Pseudomonas chlororaphis subsp. aurantiaca]